MEIPLLNDIIVILGLSVAVLFLCHKIHVPVIVGFLLTGVIAGPHGLKLVDEIHQVETLAEIGVVLLLFTIGIEFSFNKLLQIKRSVLAGGTLQVLLTIFVTFFIAQFSGIPVEPSIFIGFLLALSSTAIVLKVIQEKAEIDTPHGNTTLAILIFQDIIIVPMILITPYLAGTSGFAGISLSMMLTKGIIIIALVIAGAKWLVPITLYQISRTRSQELFLLSIVVICLTVAWLTASVGLSLALGAFLAGLIISESPYSHRALGNILPFRDIFTSFFFVSIGMLLNVKFFSNHPGIIVITAIGVIFLKSIIAAFTAIILGFPLRTSILVGLALGQVGEFSFILSRAGVAYGLLTETIYQFFLAFSVISMAATPFMIKLSYHLAGLISKLSLPPILTRGYYPLPDFHPETKKQHLIIIGFGTNGRNVARAARAAGIDYLIIEMNPETVRNEKAIGEPIYYGDSTHESVLKHANIHEAKVVVTAINDAAATRRITETVRRLNPKIFLIVRTRFVQEMQPLYALGADEVIPEEFETSVEIFSRVLARYLIPQDEIEKLISEVRADGYEMFRSFSKPLPFASDLNFNLPDVEISTLRIAEGSPLEGKSLGETEMRKKHGVTVLAIRRKSHVISNPDINEPFFADDMLVVIGKPDKIASITSLFIKADDKETAKNDQFI